MKPETRFGQKLKRIIDSSIVPYIFQRIESGGTGLGIPDAYIRTPRISCWAEVKIGKFNPNTRHIKIKWEKGQMPWLKRHTICGGRSTLMLLVGKSLFVINDYGIRESYASPEALKEASALSMPLDHVTWQMLFGAIEQERIE
jgi:hypothetical protein